MPELPEVEHICRYLRPRIVGATITGVPHADWPRGVRGVKHTELDTELRGANIERVERRAKLILIGLSGGRTLAIHLKMSGKLWVDDAVRAASKATRVIFTLQPAARGSARALRFDDVRKLGWVAIMDAAGRKKLLHGIGPDALEASAPELIDALKARRGRVKAALLDQRVVAGIGNIYADEILFAAKVDPRRKLETLTGRELARIVKEMPVVLERSIERNHMAEIPDQERVGEGRRGSGRRLGPKVYQMTGEPCPRCGTKIERIALGGRGTHFCPGCQS